MTRLAIVSVKDELEVLGPSIENRLAVGFDKVVVMAVEPSPEMELHLATLAGDPRVEINLVPRLTGDFLSFATGPLGPVIARHDPTWMLVADADEFVVPRQGHLDAVAELAADTPLMVMRFNYARRREESAEAMLARLAEPLTAPLIVTRRRAAAEGKPIEGMRWSEHLISPRPMFRPALASRFEMGAHHVTGLDGTRQATRRAPSIVLAHLALTTLPRFERKVRNARAHMEALPHVHQTTAWHWKHWVAHLEAGTLEEEFWREAYSAEEFAARQAEGAILTAEALLATLAAGTRMIR